MYASTISFVLAAAVGLINASPMPQGGIEFDTCVDQYGQLFGNNLDPGRHECTGCAGDAVTHVFVEYRLSGNIKKAQADYNTEMAACVGPNDDQQYNICVKEYGLIFPDSPSATPSECTGCGRHAVDEAAVIYDGNPNNVGLAQTSHSTAMEQCSD